MTIKMRKDLPNLARTVDDKGNEYFLFAGVAALNIWPPERVANIRNPKTGNVGDALMFAVPAEEFADVSWQDLAEISACEPRKSDVDRAGSFLYKNWRGETSTRRLVPLGVFYGATEWHPEPQWLLHAHDVDKGEARLFALKDFMGAAASLVPDMLALLKRYRNETPLGNQPHMIAHLADLVIAKVEALQ